jgi:hypothetical protein
MISSSGLFGKWCIGPAVAEIVSNSALVVLQKAFLLRLVGPHDPAVQGFIELTCPHQILTDPLLPCPDQMQMGEAIMTKEAEALYNSPGSSLCNALTRQRGRKTFPRILLRERPVSSWAFHLRARQAARRWSRAAQHGRQSGHKAYSR